MNPQAQIHRLVADVQRHQFDVIELMKLHTDDVVIVNMAGRRVVGKAAFAEAMTQALTSGLRHVPTSVEIERVHFLSSRCAVVSCRKTVHDHRPADERFTLPARVGLMTYVAVREDERWLIASAQTTPVADPAMVAGPQTDGGRTA